VETGKTPVLRDWDFGIDGGRYIRLVIKSPQLRLILVKGEDKDQAVLIFTLQWKNNRYNPLFGSCPVLLRKSGRNSILQS
jgi:hypothetical protein